MLATLALALSLSADAFAVAVSKGTRYKKLKLKQKMALASTMALAEGAAPLLGWLVGQTFAPYVEAYDHWLAYVLLSVLGLRMIYMAEHAPLQPFAKPKLSLPLLASTAVATSADAAVAGLSISLMGLSIWQAIPTIATTTFVAVLLGLKLGKTTANTLGPYAEVAGGYGLILLGTTILAHHTLTQ